MFPYNYQKELIFSVPILLKEREKDLDLDGLGRDMAFQARYSTKIRAKTYTGLWAFQKKA